MSFEYVKLHYFTVGYHEIKIQLKCFLISQQNLASIKTGATLLMKDLYLAWCLKFLMAQVSEDQKIKSVNHSSRE